MGIRALPSNTVRALGAGPSLADPTAVVKELIDNAIDAQATSINVEISSNTVDVIQVRDNGHGIAPDDRKLVAKRHYTSKIVDESDLSVIRGSFLGFRGVALASTAELSGALKITTKIDGEPVATRLDINRLGEVIHENRTSFPKGTLVRIADFLKLYPVRKRIALRKAQDCLNKTRRLLQAYAFARPYIRLSLRVFKAESNNNDWLYAPKVGENIKQIATKIVGMSCASQCSIASLEDCGFKFEGLLPHVDADLNKITNTGSFVSIDARPVSTCRGTLKQILKMFKEAATKANETFRNMKDPFLILNITCPKTSYDVNVEPAKDDVLFEDCDIVLKIATAFFDSAYGLPEKASTPVSVDNTHSPVMLKEGIADFPASKVRDFIGAQTKSSATLRDKSKTDKEDEMMEIFKSGSNVLDELSTHSRQIFKPNMYGCDEADSELYDASISGDHTVGENEKDLTAKRCDLSLNPWMIARVNSTSRQTFPEPEIEQQLVKSPTQVTDTTMVDRSPFRDRQLLINLGHPALPTPQSSPFLKTRQEFHPAQFVPDLRFTQDGRVVGPRILPSSGETIPDRVDYDYSPRHRSAIKQTLRPVVDCSTAESLLNTTSPMGTPLSAIPDVSTRPRGNPKRPAPPSTSKDFSSPSRNQTPKEKVWFDHLEHLERPPVKKRKVNLQQVVDGEILVARGESDQPTGKNQQPSTQIRDQDIRDFVRPKDQNDEGSTSHLIEQRIRPTLERSEAPIPLQTSPIHSVTPDGRHREPGFAPTSEVNAVQAHLDFFKIAATSEKRRRKASDKTALQEICTNISRPLHSDQREGQIATRPGKRTVSRRISTGCKRRKSSRLLLERKIGGQNTHNVECTMHASVIRIVHLTSQIGVHNSLPPWNGSIDDQYTPFSDIPTDLSPLASRIHELLKEGGSEVQKHSVEELLQHLHEAFDQQSACAGDKQQFAT